MQTISQKNRFKWLAVVAACLSNLLCSQAYSSDAITFKVNDETSLVLDVNKFRMAAALHSGAKVAPIKVPHKLNKLLVAADDVLQLNDAVYSGTGVGNFFLVVRQPSKTNNPMGYCGAGHEDYLLLISLRPTQLVLEDKLLVQSCLTSLDFISDNGDDVKSALKASNIKPEIRTKWMNHPMFGNEEKAIVVQDGRLIIKNANEENM